MRELTRAEPSELASRQEGATASPNKQGLLAAGGLLAALGASSCCILPLVLFGLGVSGAWIGNLTALALYQPAFVAVAVAFLTFGFWQVYRQPKAACAPGSSCARPGSNRIARIGLWAAAVLVLAAVTFPYTAPLLISL